MTFYKAALLVGVPLLLILAACSDPAPKSQTSTTAVTSRTTPGNAVASAGPIPAPDIHPPPLDNVPLIVESISPVAGPIDTADWSAQPVTPEAKKNATVRAEVLLARAHFSPGVIDGQDGGNLRNAVSAFETAHDLPVDGKVDEQVWAALAKDTRPVLTDYVITVEDVKGPFLEKVPSDMAEMAKLPALSYGPGPGTG